MPLDKVIRCIVHNELEGDNCQRPFGPILFVDSMLCQVDVHARGSAQSGFGAAPDYLLERVCASMTETGTARTVGKALRGGIIAEGARHLSRIRSQDGNFISTIKPAFRYQEVVRRRSVMASTCPCRSPCHHMTCSAIPTVASRIHLLRLRGSSLTARVQSDISKIPVPYVKVLHSRPTP